MTKPVVLTAMPLPEPLRVRLAERYRIIGPFKPSSPATLPEEARGARALVTLGSLQTSAELIAALPELGLICCYGTGYEGVDRQAAAARGILVTHAGDANATSVAEFAMGLVLASARKILVGDRLVRSGRWASLGVNRMPLVPGLAERRMGIYGLGAIGTRIAQRAAAFDMELAYHNRSPRVDVPYIYLDSLQALAEWADILVVAVRAGPANRHAINRQVLEALGPEGILVNISRGSVVDEAALCDALEAGRIAGAGLDVFEHEPHVPDRLKALENAVLTPHIAALGASAQAAQQQIVLDNLAAFFAGEALRSLVPAA